MKRIQYCRICLRTDRNLKIVDYRLSDFHDDLCDSLDYTSKPQYCAECEHVLRKLYSFTAKCKKADEVLRNWKNATPADKKPANLLYTLMPPTTLGLWTSGSNSLYEFIEGETEPTCVDVPKPMRKAEGPMPRIHLEFSYNTLQKENIKLEKEDGAESNALPSQDTTDVFEKVLIPDGVLNIKETIDIEIKLLNDDDIVKEEQLTDANISSDDEILNNKRSTRNTFVSTDRCNNKDVENQITKNKSVTDLANVLTDSNISSDDEILNNKRSTRSSFVSTDRCNNKVVKNHATKNKSVTDLANVLTDSNISSDDEILNNKRSTRSSFVSTDRCNNKIVENQATKHKSLSDLAHVTISDDDFTRDEDSEHDEHCKAQSKRTKLKVKVSKTKKHRNIVKVRNIDKDGRKNKISLTEKEINAKLDIIRKKRERLERIRLSKVPFSKERLIEKLTSLFATCGELKAEDGNKINKDFILNCLDDKVPEYVMRNLWPALHGKHTFQPKAFRIFKSIQNKYKNDHKFKSVFDIEYLTTERELAEEFQKRKTYECYINAEFKCEICYQAFKYKKLLDYHLKCHDKSVGDIICSICNVRYRSKSLLITHMCTAHGAVFKCKLCPMVTYYRASMANHYDQHRGVQFKCEPCGTTYSSRSVYINHQTKRHSLVQHACTTCGRAFVSEAGLKSHVSIKHRDETPSADVGASVKCEQCDLTFPSQEVYLKHCRITHKDLWLIISSEPGWRRQQQTGLPKKRNRCARTPKMVMTCRVCNVVGSSYGWLLQHFRTEHPTVDMSVLYADRQTHLCHVCGKGFSTVYCLRDHLNTHTGATPFPCDLCPKRFHRAMSLSQHRLRHFPPSINCTVCGKMVNTRANLFSHMRTHIGERRFKCSICDKRFLNSTTRNEHVRGVHHKIRRVRKKGVAESRAMEKVSEVPE